MHAGLTAGVVLIWAGWLAGCAGGGFERVEQLPEGIQIDELASGWATRSHASSVTDRYDEPYPKVWAAAQRVAKAVEQLGVKPVMLSDAALGQIKIRETRLFDPAEADYNPDDLRLRGWIDEFQLSVTAIAADRTRVTVARTVRGMPSFRICPYTVGACAKGYEPEVSNGRLEDWILTQIEDDLAKHPK